MRRPSLLLPLLGLALVAAGLIARALRSAPAASEDFELPPALALAPVRVPLGPAAIEGTVRGPRGAGVAEALVKVLLGDEPAWTYTDAQGGFRLDGLPEGELSVHVWSRRYHHRTFAVSAPAEDVALALEEAFGELPELPGLEGADLEGELVPLLGAQVLLGYEVLLLPEGSASDPASPFERSAVVGADRRFRLPGLRYGEYRVVVVPPWARGAETPNLAADDARHYTHTRVAAERGLEIDLARGAIVGVAFDAEGLPIADALAVVHPAEWPADPWPIAASDANGVFELRDLPPGRYVLELRAGEAVVALEVQVDAGIRVRLDLPPLAP